MRYLKLFLSVGLGIHFTVGGTFAADVKIEEKIVGPAFAPGVVYTLSPKGMRLATTHGRDGKTLVTVDGVDGPMVDRIFEGAAFGIVVKYSEDGNYTRTEQKWTGPVAFSPDGTRHAYAGLIGKEAVVILDGKEIFRGASSTSGPAVEHLQFSPDSKHLFFHNRTTHSFQSYQLMVDGQPATPPFEGAAMPFFSKDGSRWGLLAGKPRMPNQKFLVIDGKDAGYVGEQPQFTPDGKRVVCIARQWLKGTVLVDGKETVSGQHVDKVVISPTGDIGAIVVLNADNRKKLFINGKPVVDDAANVVFSPDGKRWAAVCALNQKAWVILNDGTRHKEYWPIENVTFTPDSSKLVYVATAGEQNFVVVNGKEDEGNKLIHYRPIFSESGNAFVYTAGFMMRRLKARYNDHVEPECLSIANLTLSPDGTRWVYYRRNADNTTRLMVNGKETGPSAMTQGGPVHFSADSKHFVAPLHQAFWCDDQRVVVPNTPLGFTPDNNHFIWRGREMGPNDVALNTFFVNGDLVAKFSSRGVQWSGFGIPKVWEQQPDGTIVFVGPDIGLVGGLGPMKRITVTPAPERNYTAWRANPVATDWTQKASTPTAPASTATVAPSATTPSTSPAKPATAPARPLVWADLVGHSERWPSEAKLTVQLRFDKGILNVGTAVRIEEVLPTKVRLIAPQGFTFVVDPKDCDLLEAANTQWAKLTPEQQAITGETLAADPTLWPGKVKVLENQNFGGGLQVKAGVELPVTGMKKNEVLLQHPQSKDHLVIPFRYTDVFARAHQLVLLPAEHRPGRMADLLDEATLDLDGKRAKLEKAHYYVFYFSASTCPHCEIFTPKLVGHFKKSLADRKDVMFISWPTEASTAPYLPYARKKGITWTVMPVERKALIGDYGLMEIPGIVVVDRFGTFLLATNKIQGAPLEAAEKALAQLDGVLKPVSMEFVSAKIPEVSPQAEAPAATTEVKPTTETPPAQQAVEMKWLDCDKIIGDCMQQTRDPRGGIRTSINKTVFDNKYRGLRVKFSGVVDAVKKTEGIVVFKGTGRWPTNYHVRASFPPDKLAELGKLQKGRNVTLEADIADFTLPEIDAGAMGMGPSRIILLNQVKILE